MEIFDKFEEYGDKVTLESGQHFNATGDIIDNVGTVIKTADQIREEYKLEATPDSKVATIDGKEYKLDDKGNALNDDGTVFKEAKDINPPATIEVDTFDKEKGFLDKEGNVVIDLTEAKAAGFLFNDNGDQIDDKGNVIKSKDEVVKELTGDAGSSSDSSDSDDFKISDIAKAVGVIPVDSEGSPVEYQDTQEGLQKYIADAIKQEALKPGQAAVDNFFKQNPDLLRVYNHKLIHGTIDNFTDTVDYSTVTITADNKDQHKDLIIKARLTKGDTQAEAERWFKMAEDEGTTAADAKSSLEFLKKQQEDIKTNAETIRKQQEKEQEARQAETIKEIETLVNSGKIGDIVVPEIIKIKNPDGTVTNSSREAFIDYVTKPAYLLDGVVYTAAEKAAYEEPLPKQLADDFMRFTGYDINTYINEKAGTQRVSKLKDLIKNNKSSSHTPRDTDDGTRGIETVK